MDGKVKFVYVGHHSTSQVFKLAMASSTPSSTTTSRWRDHHARAPTLAGGRAPRPRHRSGEGGLRDGEPHGQELQRRRDDPRRRSTSCSSRCTSPPGRRPTQEAVERRGHRLHLGAGPKASPHVSSTPTSCQMKRPGADRLEPSTGPPEPLPRAFLFLIAPEAAVDQFSINSTLNGISSGCCCSCSAPGLTLIFSMMGVLNFAHASFYMLGAYVAHSLTGHGGFWPALLLAPLLVGAARCSSAVCCGVHKYGHVPRTADHLRPVLRDLEAGAADLGPHAAVPFTPPRRCCRARHSP